MKKKVVCIFILIIILAILSGVFYRFVPVKKMPVNDSNIITPIKDDLDFVIGYKLNGKEYHERNLFGRYKGNNMSEKFNPEDCNIDHYLLLFKDVSNKKPLYITKYKSLEDLKLKHNFYMIYDNIIIEDNRPRGTSHQRFYSYVTDDFVVPDFKAENFEKIEVIAGSCGRFLDASQIDNSEEDYPISQTIELQKNEKVIDTITDMETMNLFLDEYDEKTSSERFSTERYPNQEVYYRISFKNPSFPLWFICH